MHKTRYCLNPSLQGLLLIVLIAYGHSGLCGEDATTGRQLLQPYTAEYVLRKNGFKVGLLRYRLIQRESGYVFTAIAQPKGLATLFSRTPIREKSVLQWDNGMLIPQWYNRTYNGGADDKIRNMQINYNRQAGLAEILLGSRKLEFEIKDGLWDTSSVQLALMYDLVQGRRELDYRVIDNDKLVEHHYLIEGIEKIESGVGEHQALKLEYHNGNRQTLFWCDVNRGFIPIKIQRYKNGKLDSEILLQSFSTDTPANSTGGV